MTNLPRLPIGIQTFAKLRNEQYLYVDKTKSIVNTKQQLGHGHADHGHRFAPACQ